MRAMRSLLKKNRIAQLSRSCRSLRMETLEGRVVLSGLPEMVVAGPMPEELAEVSAEVACVEATIIEADLGETSPTIQSPPGGNGPDDPQDPGGPLLPPRITDFSAYIEEGVLCVTGWVSDDKEVGGLTVSFGGELQGKSASVDADGFFELLLDVSAGFGGMIYAQTTDIDGLDSELVSTHVH